MTAPGTVARLEDFTTGLENFDPSEASLPRISIVHDEGVFKDSLTGEQFGKIYAVVLGLVKQRAMWPAKAEDDSRPMCKSNNNLVGYPNVTDEKRENLFPWAEYPIAQSAVPRDEFGRPVLDCKTCPFAQWGKSSSGKNDPPRCSERWTFPIKYGTEPDEPTDRAGIISFQRSGIKSTKDYLSAFVRANAAIHGVVSIISLKRLKQGTVNYSVPVWERGPRTDEANHEEYKRDWLDLLEFLQLPPRPSDDAVSNQATSGATPPAQASPASASSVIDAVSTPVSTTVIPGTLVEPAPVATAPAPASPAPVVSTPVVPDEDDEGLPF